MNDVKTTHLWFCSRDEVLGLLFHNTIGSQARKSNSSYLLSSNSNKLLSYLNMRIWWVINNPDRKHRLIRIYKSHWWIQHMIVEKGLKRMKVQFGPLYTKRESIIMKHGYDMISGWTMYINNAIGVKISIRMKKEIILHWSWLNLIVNPLVIENM